MFLLTHLILPHSMTFCGDVSHSTYILLLLYLFFTLILCNTRYLVVSKFYLELSCHPLFSLSLVCVSKDVASLHEHLPCKTNQATPVSKLPSRNKRISIPSVPSIKEQDTLICITISSRQHFHLSQGPDTINPGTLVTLWTL